MPRGGADRAVRIPSAAGHRRGDRAVRGVALPRGGVTLEAELGHDAAKHARHEEVAVRSSDLAPARRHVHGDRPDGGQRLERALHPAAAPAAVQAADVQVHDGTRILPGRRRLRFGFFRALLIVMTVVSLGPLREQARTCSCAARVPTRPSASSTAEGAIASLGSAGLPSATGVGGRMLAAAAACGGDEFEDAAELPLEVRVRCFFA